MSFWRSTATGTLAISTLAVAVTGCSTDPVSSAASGSGAATGIAVDATDTGCKVSETDLTAGIETFDITNNGQQVTEVYVYADGDRIVTEKENIGPGTSYELTVDLAAGIYQVACKPGMVGDGIRTPITVAEGTESAADPAATKAVDDYRAYVQSEADKLPGLVTGLRDAIAAGDRAKAQELYAPSRIPWESIEPVAESFGDLDPRMDAREADLEEGETFSGWHRIEKGLWQNEDVAALLPVTDQLLADVTELKQRVPNAAMTPASIGNGAKELLDEVATGKITGEEEAFSHTDLVDFQGNLDGAKKAFEVLRPLVDKNDPKLATTLDTEFANVQTALDKYRSDDTFVTYDTVTEEQRQELARAVDALSEPLSKLAAAATGNN